jgi:DNA-binding LacI/PurR family transcriptional regulator
MVIQRTSLIVKAVGALREGISEQEWTGFLPAERKLSEALQISRSTLQKALLVLQRESWIELSHGRRTRILRGPRRPARRPAARVIRALVSVSAFPIEPQRFFLVSHLQHLLQREGILLDVHFDSRFRAQSMNGRLESLLRQGKAACWLLFSVGQEVQRWFMERRVPCLVSGYTYDGIQLPSIHLDHEAVCRHAAGKFLGAGHRRVVWLTPSRGLAGELISKKAFVEAVRNSPHSDAIVQVVYHNDTYRGVQAALCLLLEGKERPTAILANDPLPSMLVVDHLLRCGMRVPEDVAVISRRHEEFLSWHVPSIASYEHDTKLYARRLAQLAIALERNGCLPLQATKILPSFHPGDSFVPVRVR